MSPTAHLVIAPILLPLVAAIAMLVIGSRRVALQRAVGLASCLGLVALAALLAWHADRGGTSVYLVGNWAAHLGIALAVDRLAAIMLLATSLLALPCLLFATGGWDRRAGHFHVFFQLQLMGLNGAFLTADLFNLFVFFEVLLISSYGLLLSGGRGPRLRSGLQYVAFNIAASTLFLVAVGLIYGITGALNMAELAHRVAQVPAADAGPLRAAAGLLLVVFCSKAALLPLYFWLPETYGAATAPVAALFAIMTKVGAYAILRTATLLFGDTDTALANLFEPWLLPLALATLGIGMLGALAAESLGRLAAYLVVASVGTLLTAFTLGAAGIAAGLYYLSHGTFASAALFLLADAIRRRRPANADRLRPGPDLPRHALWGALFFVAAIAAAGLPPLSGFLGKFLLLRAAPGQPLVWLVILLGALAGVIALAGAGSRLFLSSSTADGAPLQQPLPLGAAGAPTPRELLAVSGLLGLIAALTLGAGPAVEFAQATAAQLLAPAAYIHAVLGVTP